MPTEDQDTRLNIKVNARELNDLDRQIRKTFSPGVARDFNSHIAGVQRQLMSTVKQVASLNAQLTQVQRGTQAYQQLNQQLVQVTAQAGQAAAQLNRINQAVQAARGGGGGGGGSPGGGGGGGTARGGIGGVQLAMPGQGAIAGALTALPGVGVMAAGAFMAAAGSYSSFLRHENARMSAMPFLTRPGGALAFRGGVVRPGEAAFFENAAGNRVPDDNTIRIAGRERMDRELTRRALMGVGDTMMGLGPDPLANAVGFDLRGLRNQKINQHFDAIAGGATSKVVGAMMGAALEATTSQQRATFDTRAGGGKFHRARGPVMAQPFDPQGYMQEAIAFGINPQEGLELAGGMARAGRGPMSPQDFGTALAMQRLFGVSAEETGSAQRALFRTGGEGSVTEVADTIAMGIIQGMETSEILQELEKQTRFLEQQSDRGVKVDVGAMMAAQLNVSSRGVQAFRAGDIVRSFGMGGAQAGFRGPQSATDLRLMRAMGFTGRGGVEEFARFRLSMQDPGAVAQALPGYLAQFNRQGMGPDMQALMVQQAMAAFGTQIGPDEARALVGMAGNGEIDRDALRSLTGMGGLREAALAATSGTLRAEAGIEAERIGTGGEIAPAMQNLARTTNNLAGSFTGALGPALDQTTMALERFTRSLEDAARAAPRVAPEG